MNSTVYTDKKSERPNCAKSIPFHCLNNIWNMDGRECRLLYENEFLKQMSAFGMPTLVRLPIDPNFEYPLSFEQLVAAGIEKYIVEDYKGKSWYPHELLVLAGVESGPEVYELDEEDSFEEAIVITYCEPESALSRYTKVVGGRLKNWYRSCVAGTKYLRSYLQQATKPARTKLKSLLFKERE